MSERVYYNPPPGFAPFDFELSSHTYVFNPPDQYWTRIQKEYVVGPILLKDGRQRLNPDGSPMFYKSIKPEWIPDEERNSLLKRGELPKPKNWLDLTHDQLHVLSQSKFREWSQYLIREKDIEKAHRDDLDILHQTHDAEVKMLQERLNKAVRQLKEHVEKTESRVEEVSGHKKEPVERPTDLGPSKKR